MFIDLLPKSRIVIYSVLFCRQFSGISQTTRSYPLVIIAYANDIVIAVSGICPQTLFDKLNFALWIGLNSFREFEVSFNPSKTYLLLTRRYKIPIFILLVLLTAVIEPNLPYEVVFWTNYIISDFLTRTAIHIM